MKPEGVALLAPLVLASFLAGGCARQPGVAASDQSPAHDQQLPFDGVSHTSGVFPTASLPLADIPAGTPVTVRMQSEVSSAASHAGDSFRAVLDEPIIAEGQTIVPRGASLTGRVIAARPSSGPQEPGYLRLTLTAISLRGHLLSLQTSSVFLKGGSPGQRNLMLVGGAGGRTGATMEDRKDVESSAGRRLIFRLTKVLPVQ
jgi:hypothetical protein